MEHISISSDEAPVLLLQLSATEQDFAIIRLAVFLCKHGPLPLRHYVLTIHVVAVVTLLGGGGPHEREEALVLLEVDRENRAACLEAVFEGFVQDKRSLNLHQRAEL